ncbi:Uncharacterized protein BCGR_0292 [Mycobacterium tuberculosis variant bovis BCG]|nr:Uncharacterized protein BCGR_0292 [Mycobacterium tuberculosis variant bovis BCG]
MVARSARQLVDDHVVEPESRRPGRPKRLTDAELRRRRWSLCPAKRDNSVSAGQRRLQSRTATTNLGTKPPARRLSLRAGQIGCRLVQ